MRVQQFVVLSQIASHPALLLYLYRSHPVPRTLLIKVVPSHPLAPRLLLYYILYVTQKEIMVEEEMSKVERRTGESM